MMHKSIIGRMFDFLLKQHGCLQVLQDPAFPFPEPESPWWQQSEAAHVVHFSNTLQQKIQTRFARFWQERFISLRNPDILTGRDLLLKRGLELPPTDPERLSQALDIADLPDRILDRELHRYSNGELRRLLLARGFMERPDLWVFHDPFGGMDPQYRAHLAASIEKLALQGVPVLVLLRRPEERLRGLPAYRCCASGCVPWPESESSPLSVSVHPGFGFRYQQTCLRPVPAAGPVLFHLEHVQVQFDGVAVLGPLDWVVRKGEHWAIIGSNGAGKSTLLGLLSADHPQIYRNQIELLGKRPGQGLDVWEHKARIGLYSPELALHYHESLSILDCVCSGYTPSLGMVQEPTAAERAHARSVLHDLGLVDKEQQSFNSLSFDEKRLVLIARALIRPPTVLILDEPTQGMGPLHRDLLFRLLERIAPQTTLLMVTHYPYEWPDCITNVLQL